MTAASVSRVAHTLLCEADALGTVLRYDVRATGPWTLAVVVQAHDGDWHLRYDSSPDEPGKPWRAMTWDRRGPVGRGATAAEALGAARGAS